ncbi:hypothetical protein [Microbacterium sp. Marseille-Q6648]|uniref:hypothetical protein n=1 Tax=Microbacterium sp. Marseille-Q6648 TaxID=2937991 RepID=UPI00333BC277
MAALIHRLVTQPDLLHSTSESELIRAVHFAVIAASITVQRAGADLPTTKDVHAALQAQSGVTAKETLR